MQAEMTPNIVLSGGNSLFDGLAGRLWNELDQMKRSEHRANPIHIDH